MRAARLLASLLRVSAHSPYKAQRRVPVLGNLTRYIPLYEKHRLPKEVLVADIYDHLQNSMTQGFTREQLEARYIEEGYLSVQTDCGAGYLESFRATGVRR